MFGQKACFLDIAPIRPLGLQLGAPALNGKQCPPLRDHKHKTATRNAHLDHAEAPRALHKPLVVPAKACIYVSAYRCLVYPPTRNHRVHVTKIEWQEGIQEGESDEG